MLILKVGEIKGIVIEADGTEHPYGICRMVPAKVLVEEEGHDTSFEEEIVFSKWFQEAKIPYDFSRSIYSQMPELTQYGLSFITNASSVSAKLKTYYVFLIHAPNNITEEAKEALATHYQELKEALSVDNSYFQGEVYQDGEPIWPDSKYDLDEFYDALEIEKIKKQENHTKGK